MDVLLGFRFARNAPLRFDDTKTERVESTLALPNLPVGGYDILSQTNSVDFAQWERSSGNPPRDRQ